MVVLITSRDVVSKEIRMAWDFIERSQVIFCYDIFKYRKSILTTKSRFHVGKEGQLNV